MKSLDVLLLDDIHALAGREHVQNEVIDLIGHLRESGKIAVLVGNQSIDKLQGLKSDFAYLLETGLPMEIFPLSFSEQEELMLQIAREEGLHVEEGSEIEEMLFYIVDISGTDIRRVESAFKRVKFFAELLDEPLTIDFAEKVLDEEL